MLWPRATNIHITMMDTLIGTRRRTETLHCPHTPSTLGQIGHSSSWFMTPPVSPSLSASQCGRSRCNAKAGTSGSGLDVASRAGDCKTGAGHIVVSTCRCLYTRIRLQVGQGMETLRMRLKVTITRNTLCGAPHCMAIRDCAAQILLCMKIKCLQ